MFTDRSGLIVWFSDIKAAAKQLERYGSVHFISKRMHYAAMYVHSSKLDETTKQLQKLPFVKKVERSYRNEIKTEYTSNMPDKTRFYTL
ncbi:YlbG family protein [Paenibacillus sp. UNC451MF]|uniref:YlbG family protein n=1 Tax=Paenibacillus sp. UNC451MF TaxID=1449063 RepID=UPI000491FE68|nr:YlbG family protein [Paenibacillus sp. UNC451MF]